MTTKGNIHLGEIISKYFTLSEIFLTKLLVVGPCNIRTIYLLLYLITYYLRLTHIFIINFCVCFVL